jgi:hypothetical protein
MTRPAPRQRLTCLAWRTRQQRNLSASYPAICHPAGWLFYAENLPEECQRDACHHSGTLAFFILILTDRQKEF